MKNTVFPLFLSYLRIALAPYIWWLMGNADYYLALIFYTLGAFSDYFDGWFARRYSGTSAHGAFIDPLADKIFILTPFLYFTMSRLMPWWAFIALSGREVAVTLLRSYVLARKKKFVTAWHGKYKTFFQMLLTYIYLFSLIGYFSACLVNFMMRGVVVFTLWSGCMYFYENRFALGWS